MAFVGSEAHHLTAVAAGASELTALLPWVSCADAVDAW